MRCHAEWHRTRHRSLWRAPHQPRRAAARPPTAAGAAHSASTAPGGTGGVVVSSLRRMEHKLCLDGHRSRIHERTCLTHMCTDVGLAYRHLRLGTYSMRYFLCGARSWQDFMNDNCVCAVVNGHIGCTRCVGEYIRGVCDVGVDLCECAMPRQRDRALLVESCLVLCASLLRVDARRTPAPCGTRHTG